MAQKRSVKALLKQADKIVDKLKKKGVSVVTVVIDDIHADKDHIMLDVIREIANNWSWAAHGEQRHFSTRISICEPKE